MEALRIRYISEADIDAIVSKAGGRRLTGAGSADYQLNEAIIELKFVEEEGFHKEERQAKLDNTSNKKTQNIPHQYSAGSESRDASPLNPRRAALIVSPTVTTRRLHDRTR